MSELHDFMNPPFENAPSTDAANTRGMDANGRSHLTGNVHRAEDGARIKVEPGSNTAFFNQWRGFNVSAQEANAVEDEVNTVDKEDSQKVKEEPGSPLSPGANEDAMVEPGSPRSPSLYAIPASHDARIVSTPQVARPIPSRQPSPRRSPQRNALKVPINGRGIRRNLQFFINHGNQRRAINEAQLSRRHQMQDQQFEQRRFQRQVDELQRQHEQRLKDGDSAPCNSMPVSRKRGFSGARYVERFSVRDEEDYGRLSPYNLY
ncbi:uncharacterized protein BKA55DRAFT_715294 [Fusarium redolens]|uniref:Uncharacterized protein n=1 Tax=Fusarium redolens TaxID=48865 RepID=A0A9P9FZT0_FUSRE|nr:uncharacterized protein BKA55DRAFT_715294 [Fusarium redolens]KAH7230494.1 hypothetical protein BKA55DRAFT_715294 [Fusarium redolens]